VDAETLCCARARPEECRNLIVQVAGCGAPFMARGPDLQNETTARAEQKAFWLIRF